MNVPIRSFPRLVVTALAAAAPPALSRQSVEFIPVTPQMAPPISVFGQSANRDDLITREVVVAIGDAAAVSGYIGVLTLNRDVTLTGKTRTLGEATRAERIARSVDGVADVHNYIQPKVGA